MTGIMYLSHPGAFGYAEAARRYIVGLAHAGVPVTWTPVVPTNAAGTEFDLFKGAGIGDRRLDPFCNRQIPYDTVVIHVLPRAVSDCLRRISARTVAGYVTWDTNRLPDGWTELYGAFDSIMVPCAWNQTIFQRGGMRMPVHVVPHLFAAPAPEYDSFSSREKQDEFVFYTIGSWTLRKGTAEVVDAYLKAFTNSDNVKLIIKTDAVKISGGSALRSSARRALERIRRSFGLPAAEIIPPETKVNAALRKHPQAPKIELLMGEISGENIGQIHKKGDCFVSLTKGEAWGLGAFDAAGYGKPVIITGIGGPLDYLTADSAYLLDYRLKRVRDNSVKEWAAPGHYWAIPDPEQAARTMRHVFTHRQEAFQKGGISRNRIIENFGEQTVIQRMLKALA